MLHVTAWSRLIGQRLHYVSATFSSRLIGTLHSGYCSTTSAGLARVGESSVLTHEPLGLCSKSNRKCSRKPNKVILMIAIAAGSPQCTAQTSLSLALLPSCLGKKPQTFSKHILQHQTWRCGNRRLEVWKLITLITKLLSTLLSRFLPYGFEETRLNMNQLRGDWNRPSDHINSATLCSHEYVCWFVEKVAHALVLPWLIPLSCFYFQYDAQHFQSGGWKFTVEQVS